MVDKVKFYLRLRQAYEGFKKELCCILLFAVVLVEALPSDIWNFPPDVVKKIQLSIMFFISLIIIGMLFEILARLKNDNKKVSIIESTDLLDNISNLVKNENEIEIKYISIAGTTGWGTVLSKFLDKNDRHSLLHKRKVKIEIALIDESVLEIFEDRKDRYESVSTTLKEIERTIDRLNQQGHRNVKIDIYRYNYMPNVVGYLVNDNYLFSTLSYWEIEDGTENSYVLRGGRRSHIVYDKNDGFGGAYYIQRFKGWFEYIVSRKNNIVKPNDGNPNESEISNFKLKKPITNT